MLTPQQVDKYADRARAAFDNLELAILLSCAKRIVATDYTLPAGAEWQAERAKAMGATGKELAQRMEQLMAEAAPTVAAVFGAAMLAADEADARETRAAGRQANSRIGDSLVAQQIAQSGYRRTMNTLYNLTQTRALMNNQNLSTTVQAQLGRILDNAHLGVASGAYSLDEVVRRGIKELAAEGAEAITYPSGHTDKLETVVLRAMRTGINQTAVDISLNNAKEMGVDTMELSAHGGARTGSGKPDYTNHSWWQGKLVSLSGAKGYLSLQDIGYGHVQGFCGANCRHNWHPFWPGISTPAYTKKTLDDCNAPKFRYNGNLLTEEQCDKRQRALERQIRRWKREYLLAGETGQDELKASAARKLAASRARLKDFLQQTGRRQQQLRETVPGFGRSEASSAARTAKAANTEHSLTYGVNSPRVDITYINSDAYKAKFNAVSDNPVLNRAVYKYCKAALIHQNGDYYEDLIILHKNGSLIGQVSGRTRNETVYSKSLIEKVRTAKPYSFVSIHNHGTNLPPSGADFGSCGYHKYAFGIIACHDGRVYKYSTQHSRPFVASIIDRKVDIYRGAPYNMPIEAAFRCSLQDAANAYGIEWSELE